MKILLLEDDPLISEIIIERLTSNAYIVDYAFDILEANKLIQSYHYDIFILDVNVPNGNGFDFLTKLRKEGTQTPAIFITALNGINDIRNAFNSGCDDYIKKPFELDELEVRLENIKRLYNLGTEIKIDENITLDQERLILEVNDEKRHIRDKESQILRYLVNHKKTISNDELSTSIWDYDEQPSDATIRTYIKNLRAIIGKEKIQTVKGVGYRFIES